MHNTTPPEEALIGSFCTSVQSIVAAEDVSDFTDKLDNVLGTIGPGNDMN